MEKINKVILSLGSNIGDRFIHLKSALQKIEAEIGPITLKSSIYETEAIGFISEIPFYNICIEVETVFTPELLLKKTQEIEKNIGRSTKSKGMYESRKIDIDIIFYSSEIIDTKGLSIPHKNYSARRFVLMPLHELNPDMIDPVNGYFIADLIANCDDFSAVKRTPLAI